MDVYNKVGSFTAVSMQEVKELSGDELLLAYDNARDSNIQLEILGTPQEKIADANVAILRTEVLRRLN